MKKLMDLYTSHIEQFMGRKENLKTTSRVILANNGRFEGITTDIENKPVSFIFGNVFEDEIEVYDAVNDEWIDEETTFVTKIKRFFGFKY